MNKLMRINEVATKYDITKRTLRYYEEIGLIKCLRDDYSNYRYYDNVALKRLEQIILLREIDFSLSEIKEILVSSDDEAINKILNSKLIKIQDDINSLIYFKNVVSSIIKIRKEQGVEKVNFKELLKEQVYVNKKLERMMEMSQYVGDVIIIEVGKEICDSCGEVINSIKELRVELEDKYKTQIPLIRIRDNINQLNDYEYRILIKGIIVQNESLENIENEERARKIIEALRITLVDNIKTINM